MDSFNLKIVTPEKVYAEREIIVLVFKSSNGEFSLYAHHTDMISDVKISIISIIDKDNHLDEYAVGGGVLYFNHDSNEVKLVVNSIESKDEIDEQRALEAKVNAEKLMNGKLERRQYIEIERALQRAINRLTLKHRK